LFYYCQFPKCLYFANIRSQINYHHIKPVEIGGSDKDFNRIYLCPNHHSKIYIPEAKNGIHTIKGEDSIILLGKFKSTDGIVVEYIDKYGNKKYFLENKNGNSIL
jgi:hypothetical protein